MNNRVALVFCFVAAFSYALEIVLTDKKLGAVSPLVLTFFSSCGVACVSLVLILVGGARGEALRFPTGMEWIICGSLVFLTFAADWTHFSALHYRSGGLVLCTFYMLLPVLATMMEGEMPSWRMAVAWLLGAGALYLVSDSLT